jgi:small-conductance mechanosensitive channel
MRFRIVERFREEGISLPELPRLAPARPAGA